MELHWNESETAESIKEARAICSHVTMDAEALCSSTVKEAKVTWIWTIKEAKATHACTITEAETACSVAIRDAKTWGGLSDWVTPQATCQNHLRPGGTSHLRGRQKPNWLPLCLSGCPTCQPSRAQRHAGSFLSLFDWGRHPCPIHSPYHKGPPQWSNCLPQRLLPCQCLSSPPGPKGSILPQTMWTACLWAEPHPRQPQKGPPAPNSERSHLGTRYLSRAAQKHSARTLIWWRRLGRSISKGIPTTSLCRAPTISQRSSGRWPKALTY